MIQYKGLKPGNLAFFENEKIMIQSIHSISGRTDVTFRKPTFFQTFEECGTALEKIDFIPLSKNIMIKLNFDYFFDKQKQTAYYGYTTNGKVNKSFFIVGHQDNFEFFFGAFRKISNVHELQNLFYLITNMELPIKKLLNFDVMT